MATLLAGERTSCEGESCEMFGFLRGAACDPVCRQVYAGCCAYQRRHFGFESLPFLSYEAVFLYLFAVDVGESAGPTPSARSCCRLGTRRDVCDLTPELAEFCASFGLLLASIKLDDDVRDDRSWLAAWARWRLKRRFERLRAYFTQLDPHFERRMAAVLDAHEQNEQGRTTFSSLAEYARPTASGFAYLFGLFGGLLSASVLS